MWSTLLGLGVGTMSNFYNNWVNQQNNELMQIHQQNMLQSQQNWASNQAQIADKRTRALYSDLQSPEAKRQQLEDAGLSVGMMYGMGGAGGTLTSGAQAATPSTNNPQRIPNQALGMEAAMMMANAKKLQAETENIKEDTKKKEAETANAWRDTDVKTKQLIVMEHQINQIDQQVTESKQKCENMIEEKFNTIAERENIKNEAELKKAEKEFTEAKKDFQKIQNDITTIQLKYAEQEEQEKIKVLKAQAAQYWAATKKMNMEANQIKDLTKPLVEKACYEALMAKYEKEKIQPQEFKNMQAQLQAIIDGSASDHQKAEFYKKYGQGAGLMRVLVEDFMPF